MPKQEQKVTDVAGMLERLSALCDTGFALAIHIRYTRPSLLYRTYTKDWIDFYSEKGLMLSDPVVRWGLANTGSLAWDALEGDDPAGVLALARQHGLLNGVVYSVGPASSRTIAGFTRSGTGLTQAELAEACAIVDRVHALTNGFDGFDPAEQEALRALS